MKHFILQDLNFCTKRSKKNIWQKAIKIKKGILVHLNTLHIFIITKYKNSKFCFEYPMIAL